jgi:hypothetical protein
VLVKAAEHCRIPKAAREIAEKANLFREALGSVKRIPVTFSRGSAAY